MSGFEAINHYHGWTMAVLGAGIVFSGLVVLSFVISQIHHLVDYLEARETRSAEMRARASAAPQPAPPISGPAYTCPSDIAEATRAFQPLIDTLDDPFDLVDLYKGAQEKDLPHPHLTISCLRQAGVLVPQGEGMFSWQPKPDKI